MQAEGIAPFPLLEPRQGVLVVDGYGIRISVSRRHLVVSDGIGRYRRERAFPRAGSGLRRLVILGHAGSISLEALRWLHDVGVGVVQIDRDGEVLLAAGPVALDLPALRRAQALAVFNGAGLEVMRGVLSTKLEGQQRVACGVGANEQVVGGIQQAIVALQEALSLDAMMAAEAQGANAYWSAWSRVKVRFIHRDDKRVPEHWRTFGPRGSLVTGRPRLASNPANAMLNYLYAMLEAETRIACLGMGLDPGIGILHTDQKARDSLALDLMEAVRPEADAYLLKLVSSRHFRRADFHELGTGVCRILPPLTHELAGPIPAFRKALGPVVEQIAEALVGRTQQPFKMPTPITQQRRRSAQDAKRRVPKAAVERPEPLPVAGCRSCGIVLPSGERRFCDECLAERRRTQLERLMKEGPEAAARLRAEGRDPMKREDVRRKIGEKNRQRAREIKEWERQNGPPSASADFAREIWPSLQQIPLRSMARATGLSLQYCSLVRRGLHVPHPRHWESLAQLGKGR